MINDSDIQSAILEWRANPSKFVSQWLNVTPNHHQEQFLNLLTRSDHIAIKSGHGTGKSTVLAWTILWFLMCYPKAKIPCTAPTESQLTQVLWPEVAKWLYSSELKTFIEWTKGKIFVKGEEQTCFAVPRTATKPDALQGFHGDNVLVVIEEASGVETKFWELLEGVLTTSNAKIAALGNPTTPEGAFYDAFTKDSAFWETLTFNAEESTQVTPEFIDRMKKKYGEDSDVYRVRVKGEFPKQASDSFIPLYLCEQSLLYIIPENPVLKMGVDVARFGDDYSTWIIRAGGKIVYAEKMQSMDTVQVAGKTVTLARQYGIIAENVSIDDIGVGGGVVDILGSQGFHVNAVIVSESAVDENIYLNRRVELWGIIKEELQQQKLNLSIEGNPELTKELTGELATPKYKFTNKGQFQLESKDELKRRNVASPNLADALSYTFANSNVDGTILSRRGFSYPKN